MKNKWLPMIALAATLVTLVGCGGAGVTTIGGGGGGNGLTFDQVTADNVSLGAGVRYNDNGNGNPLYYYGAGGPWAWGDEIQAISADSKLAMGVTLADKRVKLTCTDSTLLNGHPATQTIALPMRMSDTGWTPPSGPTPYRYEPLATVRFGSQSKEITRGEREFTAGP